MTTGKDVQEVVFHFMQSAFGGTDSSPTGGREEEALALFAEHQTLRADTVTAWPPETRAAAREWLTRLLIFISMFPDLEFPRGFLSGSSPTRLGKPVLAYILEYSDRLATLDPARRGRPEG